MTGPKVARTDHDALLSPRSDGAAYDLGSITVDGVAIAVTLRVAFDGIEYVGRLWFRDETARACEVVDRAAVPGRDLAEAVARARCLSNADLTERYHRAVTEKRKYSGLRSATNDIIDKVRYLNRVALSLQAGILDADGAALEIDTIEADLHVLVGRLRGVAGIEDIGDETPGARTE